MNKLPDAGSGFFFFLAFALAVFFFQAPQHTRASAPTGDPGVVAVHHDASGALQGVALTDSEKDMLEQNPAMLQPGGDVSDNTLLIILVVVVAVLIVLLLIAAIARPSLRIGF